MSSDPDRMDPLDRLVDSVSNGQRVDWPDTEPAMSADEQVEAAALRDIARIAEFNRKLQSSGHPEEPLAETMAAAGPEEAARWGDLVLLEPLGAGASGEVWRAWDLRLRREVALKFLQSRSEGLAGEAGAESPLLAEARALARLRHAAVVTVYGIAEHGGRAGMWMELLHGETLAAAVERGGPLRPAEVARIGRELAWALDAVHEAGLVHRDLKPANVVLASGGRVVLTDFGLGRSRAGEGDPSRISGTPMFMAPELFEGEPSSPRSDLYALGVTLRFALTGRLPFRAQTFAELKAEAARGPATPLHAERTNLSGALVSAIEQAMAPAPAARFANAADLARALAGELPRGLPGSLRPAGQLRHTLPAEPDAFVGREAEIEELEGRLEIGSRLVTLLGAGGMGKTRLAVRYGWQRLGVWPGGVWFCDLTESRTLNGIVSAVAGSLGVPLGKGDPIVQLAYAIAGRGRCLMILDNFEQVIGHAGETVERWLERAAEARFLVTSRERLNVRGEEVQAVGPLRPESGVELFIERARRLEPGFDPQGSETDAVEEVVRLTEGMPLAIELAAARVRMIGVAGLVQQMRERFRVLGGTGSGRHASLRAAIDDSWELLQEWEKAAWAQCGVFKGGFTLEAAKEVVDLSAWPEAPWVVDVMQSLVDKSLLRTWVPRREPGERAPETRLGMYVSLQEYARLKLREEGAIARGGSGPSAALAAEERHGRCYARYGTQDKIDDLDQHGGVERRHALGRELENLVAACQRAVARRDSETALATYRAASHMFLMRGPFEMVIKLGQEVLDWMPGPEHRARILFLIGWAELYYGRTEEAQQHLEAALAIYRALGDRGNEGIVCGTLGILLMDQGRMRRQTPIGNMSSPLTARWITRTAKASCSSIWVSVVAGSVRRRRRARISRLAWPCAARWATGGSKACSSTTWVYCTGHRAGWRRPAPTWRLRLRFTANWETGAPKETPSIAWAAWTSSWAIWRLQTLTSRLH